MVTQQFIKSYKVSDQFYMFSTLLLCLLEKKIHMGATQLFFYPAILIACNNVSTNRDKVFVVIKE